MVRQWVRWKEKKKNEKEEKENKEEEDEENHLVGQWFTEKDDSNKPKSI